LPAVIVLSRAMILRVRRNDFATLSGRDALLFAQSILPALCKFIGSRRSIRFD
jgi:hypothetical protein